MLMPILSSLCHGCSPFLPSLQCHNVHADFCVGGLALFEPLSSPFATLVHVTLISAVLCPAKGFSMLCESFVTLGLGCCFSSARTQARCGCGAGRAVPQMVGGQYDIDN